MPFPVDLKYIEELKNDLGLEFPEIYKTKMIEENGGQIHTDEDEWFLFHSGTNPIIKGLGEHAIILVSRQIMPKRGSISQKTRLL